MIQPDQKILFISQANVIAIIKQNESIASGLIQKKIVVTTRRCLIFQSLANKSQQVEFQMVSKKTTNPKDKQPKVKKSRISINQHPQFQFDVMERDVKVVIQDQPSIPRFLQKLGIKNFIKNTVGICILKNSKKQKFQLIQFSNLKDSFRFAKGIMCAKSWVGYEKHCSKQKLKPNLLWARILQQIVTHQKSLTLIDPDMFQQGSPIQLSSFMLLIKSIPFAHSFQLRYNIVNQQSLVYTIDFVKNLQQKMHMLSLYQTSLTSQVFSRIFTSTGLKLKCLLKLNLQKNQLNDHCFVTLQSISKQNKKLSYINLAYNHITLNNFSYLLQFLKTTTIILNLNLSNNKITDRAVQQIQKFIIFALNPPIQELDLSFNQFTQKAAWRLYVGYLKNFKNHVYLNFMVYPIPFKKQIFFQNEIDFPRKQNQINFNMHSALVQQFQQESMMKHTLADIVMSPDSLTIRFIRVLLPNVRLPKNKQQVSKTLQISNKIQNFIYSSQSVQKILQLSSQMKSFPFQIPLRSRTNFIQFLNKRLNQALLIRDHYSVKFIISSMKALEISYAGYTDRLDRVGLRDKIISSRLEGLVEFRVAEQGINNELDQLVKQGLRLYLEGKAVQLLYYLKFCRDQAIERLLSEKYNPQHQIFSKMALKNLSGDNRVSAKDFIIPYEIKIQKRINQNFYLHPWQTSYIVLAQMNTKAFVDCLQFLQQSDKKQTFAKYFQRIEQRVQFVKNEFTLFTYKQFKISYTDLKINACRLLFLYRNIQQTHFYIQIPIYIRKKPISSQRSYPIPYPQSFLKRYHIVNYPNISNLAKKQMFYNYQGIITRYQQETFLVECRKMLGILKKMFDIVQADTLRGRDKQVYIMKITLHVKELIDVVRHSIYPEEIKEELYLHLIGWRKGKYGKNTQILELVPWFTMYLKPPIQIQKYLVGALLQAFPDKLDKMPLCIVSDPTKPTPQDILRLDQEFVQRDWFQNDFITTELMLNHGKIFIEIQLLDKKKLGLLIPQSTTISQLVLFMMGFHELNIQDRECFWLYKLDKQLQQLTALTGSDYLGEVISCMNTQAEVLVCRRRLFSREIRYIYPNYGEAVIDSLYSEVKFDYMMRGLFNSDRNIYEVTSLLFIIDNIENYQIIKRKQPKHKRGSIDQFILEQIGRLDSVFPAYIPRQVMTRIMKSKDSIFGQIKAKVSQRMLKKEHLHIYDMKVSFMSYFAQFPQFCSSNYKFFDKTKSLITVCLNSMYLYIQSQTQKQFISIQKIISIIPKSKYLLICYHKNQNIVGQIALFNQQVHIIALAMDILCYCMMRLKMVSSNLYQIHRLQRIKIQNDEIEKSMKKVYNKALQHTLNKNRQQMNTLQAKILKMNLTLMNLKQLVYYNQSRYIKTFLDRKLYANKSQKKMNFSTQMDQEQARQTQKWNQNVFELIFPLYQNRFKKGIPIDQYPLQVNDMEFDQESIHDISFYSQQENNPQTIKKKDENPKQINSPFKPTQKKVDKKQNLSSKPILKDLQQTQIKNPSSSLKKPTQQPKQTKPYQQPSPLKTPIKQPIQDQVQSLQDDVVVNNKRAGGRTGPPKRRQR